MVKKQPPNWEEIKTRYTVHGEKPAEIAPDYNITARTIQKRVSEEKWRQEREAIGQEIRQEEVDRRKRIVSKIGVALEYMLDNIIQDMPNMGATVQDGEGFPNKYHLEAWRSCVASYVKPDKDEQSEEEPAGFNVGQDA